MTGIYTTLITSIIGIAIADIVSLRARARLKCGDGFTGHVVYEGNQSCLLGVFFPTIVIQKDFQWYRKGWDWWLAVFHEVEHKKRQHNLMGILFLSCGCGLIAGQQEIIGVAVLAAYNLVIPAMEVGIDKTLESQTTMRDAGVIEFNRKAAIGSPIRMWCWRRRQQART